VPAAGRAEAVRFIAMTPESREAVVTDQRAAEPRPAARLPGLHSIAILLLFGLAFLEQLVARVIAV
jgi:hypothetical protein